MKITLHSLHPEFPPSLRFPRGPDHVEAVGPWADRLAALPAAVAIVGTRRPAPDAWRFTYWLSASLASVGATILSGGAYGIDAAAHEGALSVGGATIAVLPSTLDRFMPAGNSALFRRIRATGALVSIAPAHLGGRSEKPYYHERNAVIAALAAEVVVVAAGHRSGAIVTATAAEKLEKRVWVVPGSPWDLSMQGCALQLLENARALLTPRALTDALGLDVARARDPRDKRKRDKSAFGKPRDVLFERPWERAPFDPNPEPPHMAHAPREEGSDEALTREVGPQALVTSRPRPASPLSAAAPPSRDAARERSRSPQEITLIDALTEGPATMDELVLRTALPVGPVRTLLLTWTVEGVVREGPAGLFRLSSH